MHTVTIETLHDPLERVTPRLLVGPGDEGCAHMAAVSIEVPAGRRMGEHAHGDSEAVLTVVSGEVVLRAGDRTVRLRPGVLAHIAAGERVEVENPGDRVVSLLAIFSPPEFAARLPR
jgi:quercetin dioxygenase-like cupin family protein